MTAGALLATRQPGWQRQAIAEFISCLPMPAPARVAMPGGIHGATPNKLAPGYRAQCGARAVSDINLPMPLRVLNYRQQALPQPGETTPGGDVSSVRQGNIQQGYE